MKLDLLKNSWLDIVFEGRNKMYGAYELRRKNGGVTLRALLIGALIFVFLLSTPLLAKLIPDSKEEDEPLDQKIVTVKIPPKEIPKDLPPPPPPKPKVEQVKFVKPVVAKAEEVVEDPPPQKELVDKTIGDKNVEASDDGVFSNELPAGTGEPAAIVDDNKIYNTAGIEVKPDFPGGIAKFYKFVQDNFRAPEEEGLKGNVIVTFVVEKDGSLTDIKVVRDIGYGTKDEAIRVLRKSPKWTPGEQNGKKVRVLYSLPIRVQSPD
jgi:protein TonB